MAADREQGKIAPVNPRALTWYGEANVIIDEWADQFVQTANRRPGEVGLLHLPEDMRPDMGTEGFYGARAVPVRELQDFLLSLRSWR
jgi:hypothetical protein